MAMDQPATMTPLDYMNRDCWEFILDMLGAEDKKRAGESCAAFRNILGPKKTLWMFELVLPHLIKYFSKTNRLNNLLKCRLVCKSWDRAINEYLETKIMGGHECEDFLLHSWLATRYTFDFGKEKDMDMFFEKFRDHRRNPILGKYVEVLFCTISHNPNQITTQMRQIEKFMPFIGRWIQSFHVKLRLWNATNLEKIQILQKLLSFTPNLRSLNFFISNFCNWRQPCQQVGVDRFLEENPFPELPNLTYIRAEGSRVTKYLLEKYAETIETLAIDESCCLDKSDCWGNLKSLKKLTMNRLISWEYLLRFLRSLRSPLETLSVAFKLFCFHWDYSHSMAQFNSAVEDLPLKHLTIYYSMMDLLYTGDQSVSVEVPQNMTIQSVSVSALGPSTLEFLQHFSALETLNVYDTVIRTRRNRPMGYLHGRRLTISHILYYHVRCLQSNVWELMPRLQVVNFFNPNGQSLKDRWTRKQYLKSKKD